MRTTRNGWLIVCGLILVVAIGHATARVVAQPRRATGGTPLSEPRIPRVEKPWTDAERELLAPRERNGQVIGVWSTCAKSPDLCRAWLGLTDYLLSDSTLPVRDRELLILRIAWLTHGAYEWAAHVGLARRVGLSDAAVRRILDGPDAPGWTAWDRTLLRAVDELHADALVSDETWAQLAQRYDQRQLTETIFTVGQYNLVAMWVNSLGVQFEPGFEGFPVGP